MEPRTDPAAVSAKVLENGGVVLELETEEAAAWLLDSGVRKAFESNFGGSARLVDQLFHVVVNFLPVTLRDTLHELIPSIVRNNCITTDTLVKCRWLKAPKYWKEEQRFAHAVLSFNERADASRVIQQGVVIEGQRFKTKKMEEMPKRCFKCQRIGHLASKCKEISVICPNCAGAHTGEECRAESNRYRCINCSKTGRLANHASWDHACPSMEAEKKKRVLRNPDSQYRYFPTDEVWTWAKKDRYSDEEAQGAGMKWDTRAGGAESERRADKGWKGMRDRREAEAARGEDEWTTVRARRNKDLGTRGMGRDTPNFGTAENQTNTPQVGSQGSSQRNYARSAPSNGRQSRLGDFWKGKGREEGEDSTDPEGAEVNNILNSDLC